MKNFIAFKLTVPLFALFFASGADNLVYKNVESGVIKVLVPADFKYLNKADFKLKYPADADNPDDYFSNPARSEEVLVSKEDPYSPDLSTLKPMMNMVATGLAATTYFNDTTRMNGMKVYVFEIEAKDGDQMKYIKEVLFNAGKNTYMVAAACWPGLKSKWKPTGEKILNSIKIN